MSRSFDTHLIASLARQHGTPLWIYDAGIMRERMAQLRAFDTVRFAQKACSNTHVLRLLRDEGAVVDAVSLGEVQRALAAGFRPGAGDTAPIVYTADVLGASAAAEVIARGIPVNAGSIDMLDRAAMGGPGYPVWLRINPGFGHGHSDKTNTGGENSKHGIWHTQLPLALDRIRRHRLHLCGLHMHIGSGVDYGHLVNVCDAMADLVIGMDFDLHAISAGGGLSIPYREGQARVDMGHYFSLWNCARRRIEAHLGHPVRLEIEPGRFLVAEAGVLVAEVLATKEMGRRHYTLVDAGFNDLVRPAMYGAHHRMTVLTAAGEPVDRPARETVVAGPLCESGDVFTLEDGGTVSTRLLPAAEVGDLVVFHDAGAYGAAMSSNYNSRPLAPEVLVDGDRVQVIRRRQTIQELLALEGTGVGSEGSPSGIDPPTGSRADSR